MPAEFLPVETILERDSINTAEFSDLIYQVQNGDKSAFEALYREHVGHVYAICLRISADPIYANELTQDVFIRVWEVIGSFEGKSAFSTWLHRLAVNVVLLDLRSQKRRTKRIMLTENLSLYDKKDKYSDPGIQIDLENAIVSLPTQARTVFVLYDIEGYRHDEIAELMGLSTGTTKAQLHRARRLLKERLNK